MSQTFYRAYPMPYDRVFVLVFQSLSGMGAKVMHSDPSNGRILCQTEGSSGGVKGYLDVNVRPVPEGTGVWMTADTYHFLTLENRAAAIRELVGRLDGAYWAQAPRHMPGPVPVGVSIPDPTPPPIPPLFTLARTFERPSATGPTVLALLNGALFLGLFLAFGDLSDEATLYIAMLFTVPYFLAAALMVARLFKAAAYVCGPVGLSIGFLFVLVAGPLAFLMVILGVWAARMAFKNAWWDRTHKQLYGAGPAAP